ncbi:MAG: hypothetical protein WAK56_00240 [Candidatus Sulfotelmatobacter sp.]
MDSGVVPELVGWAIAVPKEKAEVVEAESERFPMGVIEVSDQPTRFVPIIDKKKLIAAVLAGIGLGMWLGWSRRG